MTFGDPIIYHCPSCRKMMKMLTFRSYTSRSGGSIYSDSYFTGGPHFTSDLAKCPHCKKMFFRHNDKNAIEMDIRTAGRIKYIEDPWLEDLLGVITNDGKIAKGFVKNRKEERTYRLDLWHELNKNTRSEHNKPDADELELWKNNCAALLPLMEKTLKEMQSEKNSAQYRDKDRDNCLLQTAELNRNLGNFDECMKLINKLNSDWDSLKKQFARECEAKNIFSFELFSENKPAAPPKPEHADIKSLDIKSETTEKKMTFETPKQKPETAKPETTTQSKAETEFVIFDDWTEIPDWHFIRDNTYTSFVIHDNITRIGKCAFAQCRELKKLNIGKNVINIEKYAFRKDNRPGESAPITEVINRSVKPQLINEYHFYNTDLSKAVLRVPEQSIEAYKTAEGWKDFGVIEALDEEKYPPYKMPVGDFRPVIENHEFVFGFGFALRCCFGFGGFWFLFGGFKCHLFLRCF
jgi:hypothetical protein